MGMVVMQPYILVSKLKKTKTKFLRSTGYLPFKTRFIANASSCTTKENTSCLTAVKNMISSTVKRYMRDPIKLFWSNKNSGEILDKLKARYFNALSLSTYAFSILYTALPHNLIKYKLIDRYFEY